MCVYWNNEELSGLLGREMRRMIGALDVECGRERRNAYRVFGGATFKEEATCKS